MKTRIYFFCFVALSLADGFGFRVMTFNIWNCGSNVEDGVMKIAKHISLVNPDMVSLQEVEYEHCAKNITDLLEGDWTIVGHDREYPDAVIITKHKVISSWAPNDTAYILANIEMPGGTVAFWGIHAAYEAYGPYAAYNKLVTNISQIMAAEHWHQKGRAEDIESMTTSTPMFQQLFMGVAILVAGDFNSPSDLDWTEEAKHLHGGWAVEWPATAKLKAIGFIDSFRQYNPDPIQQPANTWSTCNKFNAEYDYAIPEPQDRIDFIFYTEGSRQHLRAARSQIYAGTEPIQPIPYHQYNDWPSDHYAVITDFVLLKEKPRKIFRSSNRVIDNYL